MSSHIYSARHENGQPTTRVSYVSYPFQWTPMVIPHGSQWDGGSSRQMTASSGRRPATSPLARPRPSSKLWIGGAGQRSEESSNQTHEAASRRFEPSRTGFRGSAKQGKQQQDKEQSNRIFGRSVRRGAGWSKSRALTGIKGTAHPALPPPPPPSRPATSSSSRPLSRGTTPVPVGIFEVSGAPPSRRIEGGGAGIRAGSAPPSRVLHADPGPRSATPDVMASQEDEWAYTAVKRSATPDVMGTPFPGGTIRAPYGHGRRVATPTYGVPEGDRLWSGGLREREKDKMKELAEELRVRQRDTGPTWEESGGLPSPSSFPAPAPHRGMDMGYGGHEQGGDDVDFFSLTAISCSRPASPQRSQMEDDEAQSMSNAVGESRPSGQDGGASRTRPNTPGGDAARPSTAPAGAGVNEWTGPVGPGGMQAIVKLLNSAQVLNIDGSVLTSGGISRRASSAGAKDYKGRGPTGSAGGVSQDGGGGAAGRRAPVGWGLAKSKRKERGVRAHAVQGGGSGARERGEHRAGGTGAGGGGAWGKRDITPGDNGRSSSAMSLSNGRSSSAMSLSNGRSSSAMSLSNGRSSSAMSHANGRSSSSMSFVYGASSSAMSMSSLLTVGEETKSGQPWQRHANAKARALQSRIEYEDVEAIFPFMMVSRPAVVMREASTSIKAVSGEQSVAESLRGGDQCNFSVKMEDSILSSEGGELTSPGLGEDAGYDYIRTVKVSSRPSSSKRLLEVDELGNWRDDTL